MSILAVNSGSSTLKFGVFRGSGEDVEAEFAGAAEGIGREGGRLAIRDGAGISVEESESRYGSQQDALQHVAERLKALSPQMQVDAVGHRVVHGGPELRTHQRITPAVMQTLERDVHFAPLHIPASLALIRAAETLYPEVPQFACFDTAFHGTLPEEAFQYALPEVLRRKGVRRYGFHGLSCESIVRALGAELKAKAVIAHLGSGASVTAVLEGRSVDTSMGLTPAGGVVMVSRPGDLDPGLIPFVERMQGIDADGVEEMLNHASGLVALAGTSDVRAIEDRARAGDAEAEMAIRIFSRSVAKTIAGYTAVLNGLELLVFTGGIGEHSASVRAEICAGLRHLGVEQDGAAPGSRCEVRVVPSREEEQIAWHVTQLLG